MDLMREVSWNRCLWLRAAGICGFQTRSYWSVLARRVLQEDNPLESLQVALISRAPTDFLPTEFRRALVDGDLYGLRACRHLLERDGSKEYSDTSNYSIEHILPQNESLRTEWQEMLGNEWKQVQRDWRRLGNLTPPATTAPILTDLLTKRRVCPAASAKAPCA